MNIGTPKYKVIRPLVAPGVKQTLNAARYRVDSTEVWSLVQIAAMAGEREILEIIAASELPGYDVFNLVWHRAMFLAKPAVLAAIFCPVSNETPEFRIHW